MKVYTFKVTIAMPSGVDYDCKDVNEFIMYQDDGVAVEVERIDTYVTKVEN